MPAPSRDEITTLLLEADGSAAGPAPLDRLIPAVYEELRGIAGHRLRGRGDVTLSPTELVHEAYLRMADVTRVTARGRAYFFAAAARAMRNIIVDYTRRRGRGKRGGGERPVTLVDAIALLDGPDIDVLSLDEGLQMLAGVAERPARVVECRFFGGLSIDETALTLGVTPRTVNRDWLFARAWLFDYLDGRPPDGTS